MTSLNSWDWNGARWWKFDFHAHTPASEDYGKGPDQAALKALSPEEWLLEYMRAGIDCVAVTDHNTGAWVDKLKSALDALEAECPESFRPLHLFPGVEISVNGGIHLLAVLDQDKATADIDSLLGAVGFTGDKGANNAVTTKSFAEVARTIEGFGGIAIPAHVDGEKGLFTLQGTTLRQALECGAVFAMELVDPAAEKPSLYQDRQLNWTEVIGSDSHHPSGDVGGKFPGSHYTWVKMGSPNIEGLRLALLDGAISARRSEQVSEDPNVHAPLVIESIEVSKAQYVGRSRAFELDLNPWLNALIGGRGTGKSTLVEFLRLVFRREADLPPALAEDFKKYRQVCPGRNEDGLLTDDSVFTVSYRKHGARFRVQWSQRGDAEPVEVQDEDGEWRAEQGDITQRFPVRIYSQKQIFELARDPLALLRIVDEASEVDRRSWDDSWREEEARFLSLRARAREIEAGLVDEPTIRGALDDVERRLKIFEEAGHADVLKQYQKRLRQQRTVDSWERTWSEAGERLRGFAGDLVPEALEASQFEPDEAEDQDILQKASAPITRLESVQEKLEGLASEIDEVLSQWRQDRDESSWKRAVDQAIQQYHDLRERLTAGEAGDPSAYGELVQHRQTLEGRLKDLRSRRDQISSIRDDAEKSLQRLKELRRDLTRRRSEFLKKVLEADPYVRIEVIPYEASETVEGECRRLLQRQDGRFERDIGSVGGGGLLGELYARDRDAGSIEQALDLVKERIKNIATGNYHESQLADQRFAAHLANLPPESLDRLDAWFPEDWLRVQYSNPSDGRGFRSIQEGSPGQKTAALLAFLFSYGEEPIILDQPEDDLDNHLIYDLIVTQLRRIKQKRQIIVVTHNANIVVNGDAELVVALIARGGETHKECAGSLQERKVRDTICAVMEGGREAFDQRYRRIALEAPHV